MNGERARPGRSFPRPRGKPGRTDKFQTAHAVSRARCWTRGASSHTRGGCAPQLRNSDLIPTTPVRPPGRLPAIPKAPFCPRKPALSAPQAPSGAAGRAPAGLQTPVRPAGRALAVPQALSGATEPRLAVPQALSGAAEPRLAVPQALSGAAEPRLRPQALSCATEPSLPASIVPPTGNQRVSPKRPKTGPNRGRMDMSAP